MHIVRPLLALLVTAAVAAALAGCGGTTTVVAGGPESAPPPRAGDASARPATAPPPEASPGAPGPSPRSADEAGTPDGDLQAPAPDPAPAADEPGRTGTTGPAPPDASADAGPEDTGGVLVERPAGFPDGGERFLLARLDPEIARRCTRALTDSLSRGAVAGLFCDGREDLGAAIHYELFRSRLATEDAYGRYRRANDVPLAAGDCLRAGGDAAPAAESGWRLGAPLGAGRAMCFAATRGRWLVSSHPPIRTLTFLLGDDSGALRRLWVRRAAPAVRPR